MPNYTQIDNPQGAFGYQTTVNTPPPFHGRTVLRFRNLSTAHRIDKGCAVVLGVGSTVTAEWGAAAAGVLEQSTCDEGVFVSTVKGHPGVIGVALTSAAVRTTGTTLGVGARSSEYADICVAGPAWGLFSSGATATTPSTRSRFVTNSVTTASTASTVGIPGGGMLTLLSTANITTANGIGGLVGVVGMMISSAASTGTTGELTTVGSRALLWVRPQVMSLFTVA